MEFFKSDNGQMSFARISGAVILVFNLAWGTWTAYHSKSMPDLPTGWAGIVTLMYGLNKWLTKAGENANNNVDTQQ